MANITWHSGAALRMVVIAMLPVLVLLSGDVEEGLVLAIGVLPAALIPLPPKKRDRTTLILVGAAFAVSLLIGSLLAQIPWLAVVGIGALAFYAAFLLSTRFVQLSGVLIAMCVPVVAIGFSYTDIGEAASLAILILAGSTWAYLVSLLSPERKEVSSTPLAPAPRKLTIIYATAYAGAAMLATTIPFLLGWQHVGWVAGAALFVMRPSWQTQQLRMVGRILSVFIGAMLACVLLQFNLPVWLVGVFIALALIIAAGTQGSRWYLTPAFTTFIVFFILLYVSAADGEIQFRFVERVSETAIGVAIAGLFGWLLVLLAKQLSPAKKT